MVLNILAFLCICVLGFVLYRQDRMIGKLLQDRKILLGQCQILLSGIQELADPIHLDADSPEEAYRNVAAVINKTLLDLKELENG